MEGRGRQGRHTAYSDYRLTCTVRAGFQVVLGKQKNKEKPSGTVHINMTPALGKKI